MNNFDNPIGEIPDRMSMGWEHMYAVYKSYADRSPILQETFASAKIGFDLGSGGGQSAYALYLLCPKLAILHCVDSKESLYEPFQTVLNQIAIPHVQTMQEFVHDRANTKEKADVVLIASMMGQPFFKTENLNNLALSIRPKGILITHNHDIPHRYNESPMTDYFTALIEENSFQVWQRNE